ncbi:MAG: DUF1573 domain-containing protein [Bacteroidales bacterium]|nr:DUF1573 domain-containing protein [Bacteroidales bacterium]
MKRFALLFTILMICTFCNAKNGANISFKTKVHDFGEITEESKTATYDFLFTNTGTGPLVIHKAIASCGCTTPVYSKEPIAAGTSSNIKVTYNTVGRPGSFHKTITIYCNDIDSPNIILVIKGKVIPKQQNAEVLYPKDIQGLRLSRGSLSLLDAKIGSIRTETIDMINTNTFPVNISFYKVPKHIRIIPSKSTLGANETGTLTIKYTPKLAKDYGKRQDSFYVVTEPEDKENPNNRIQVSAFITEDFSYLSSAELAKAPKATYSDNRINLGIMMAGSNKTTALSLTNDGKSPLYIRKIMTDYDGIKVTPEKKEIQAGKTIKMKVNFYAGTFSGHVAHRISIFTNDPNNSLNRVLVTALVKDKK